MDKSTPGSPQAVVPHSVLSAVSHELRGPLGVARGYLRLLAQRDDLDERAGKAVTEITRATDRMAALVDTLAEYVRWARGEAGLTPRPTPVGLLLTRTAAVTRLPDSLPVRLEAEAAPELVASVDATRLIPALAALTSALAHAQVGPARLRLIGQAAGDGRCRVLVATDRGPETTVTERPANLLRPGPGLALPLAELVIRLHGGDIVERWSANAWSGYEVRL